MGGYPKGLLRAPDTGEPLVLRLVRLGRAVGCEPVLVGDATPYVSLSHEIPVLHDAPQGIGPLGGLSALLTYAGDRAALAVACDMPYVTAGLLTRLATTPARAAVLAPRYAPDGPFEPLFARYHSIQVRSSLAEAIACGVRSFQTFFRTIPVEPLPLEPAEQALLRDWDRPDDIDARS